MKITRRQLTRIIHEESRRLQEGSSREDMLAALSGVQSALDAALDTAQTFDDEVYQGLNDLNRSLYEIKRTVRRNHGI